MQHARAHHRPRHGFTLVEMLVVITIIGVLVALLIPTVNAVMKRTKTAATAVEMQDLAKAIDAYKTFANDYPPDFSNRQAVINHIAKAFPRNSVDVGAWYDLPANVTLDPAEALVVWLAMLSTNPRNPLEGTAAIFTGERKTFFTFDETRLGDTDQDGWKEYYPKYGNEKPYVYFDGRLIGGKYAYWSALWPKPNSAVAQPPAPLGSTIDVIRPFRSGTDVDARDNGRTYPAPTLPIGSPPSNPNRTQWMKPGQFQILCAGLDNEFGTDLSQSNAVIFKTFPQPNYGLPGVEEDNLADFAELKTLGDSVP